MRANELRHRITIQQRSSSEDALGQQLLTWTNVVTSGDGKIAAKVEQLSGRELMTASAERAENTARIMIRFRSDLTEKMRILYGAIIYDITSVSDIEGRRRELEVMCKTGVSNG